MFLKLFSCVLLCVLFNVVLSAQTIIESNCNDQCELTRHTLYGDSGDQELTAVLQMESTNAFEPILSLELMDHPPYNHTFMNALSFKFNYMTYEFRCRQSLDVEPFCEAGYSYQLKPTNCSINIDTNACKWLIMLGMDGEKEERIETLLKYLITQPYEVIALKNMNNYNTVALGMTDVPIYHWSYALCCEYNKKVYYIYDGMLTLKKDEDIFELFIYRSAHQVKKHEKVTLINSKNHSISISCDDDRNDIIVSNKNGMQDETVLDKYIFRKHIDGLRCGISLSLEIRSKYSSFSFNDTPLKLVYELKNVGDLIIQGVKFDSDFIAPDKHEIKTTNSVAYVDENQKIESTSTTSMDQQVDENSQHDSVNPATGFFSRFYNKVKSYFEFGNQKTRVYLV